MTLNPINFFHTHISQGAASNIAEVLASSFISEGKLVSEFENQLSSHLGIRNPIALNSGTSALHLALVLSGIKPGDEVILPPQTFIASGLAVKHASAVPIFADIQYETGNIDPNSIRNKLSEKTKAIMVVHWGGYPCDMTEILKISEEFRIPVVEDAAHALGATYRGTPIGAISPFTCFSFQAIKHVTTGDGGAIAFIDEKLAATARKLRWFGIDRSSSPMSTLGERIYNTREVGYKYHMNDYAAALGLSNLNGFTDRLNHLRKVTALYREGLKNVVGLDLFRQDSDREGACWLFGVHVQHREEFVRKMKTMNIPVSVVHQRIDRNDVFGGKCPDLTMQAKFDSTQIHLPINSSINDDQVRYVIDSVREGW